MPIHLRALIIEDNPANAELMLHELRRADIEPVFQRVETEHDFRAALDDGWDIILAGSSLPQLSALRALAIVQERRSDIPLVVVTGRLSEEEAVECIRHGAADYLLRDQMVRLGPAVRRALEARRLRADQERALAALRESEARYRRAIALANAVVYEQRFGETRYRHMGEGIEAITGYRPEEFTPELWRRSVVKTVMRGEAEGLTGEEAARRIEMGQIHEWRADYLIRTRDGTLRWLADSAVPILDAEGRCIGTFGILQDVTDRRNTEAQLQRSNERLAVLNAVALVTMGSLSPEDLCRRLAEIVRRTLPCDAYFVDRVDPFRAHLQGICNWDTVDGRFQEVPVQDVEIDPEGAINTVVLKQRRPLVIQRGAAEPPGLALCPFGDKARRSESLVFVPLVAGNRAVGVMSVQSYTPGAHTAEHVELITAIGRLVGPALDASLLAQDLRHSEVRFRIAAECASDLIYDWDLSKGVLHWFGDIDGRLGFAPGEFPRTIEAWESVLHPEDRERTLAALRRSLDELGLFQAEYRVIRRDGEVLTWLERGLVLADAAGRAARMVGACSDITEQRRIQEQLLLSQKMEAVGQLAGGVAHDFNNILLCILGFADLALDDLPADSPLAADLGEIRRAAQRAATLTRQLLAFSRRAVLQPVDLDLNQLIADLLRMLRRLIGENIQLTFRPAADLATVHADPGQVEQMLLNICVNARDAMPRGGKITIETGPTVVGEQVRATHPWVHLGPHAAIRISDTGPGIAPEVLPHIFEPFFTTKEVGKGTGLGLATVYGIAKQHGGFVEVHSELGHGATFTIHLPTVERPAEPRRPSAGTPPPGGHETILVAEDEPAVRHLTQRVLANAGYRILLAADGEEAVQQFEQHRDEVALVILDAVMPVMGGAEARERIRALRPDVKVLLTTGHSFDPAGLAAMDPGDILLKPHDAATLLWRVRERLDAP